MRSPPAAPFAARRPCGFRRAAPREAVRRARTPCAPPHPPLPPDATFRWRQARLPPQCGRVVCVTSTALLDLACFAGDSFRRLEGRGPERASGLRFRPFVPIQYHSRSAMSPVAGPHPGSCATYGAKREYCMKDTTLSERSDARRSPHCPHVPAKPTAGCPMCRQWKAGVVQAEHNERVEAIADTLTRVHIEKKLRCAIKRQAHMRHRRRVVRGRPQRPIPRACWWRIASVEAPRVALAQRWRERRAGGTRCQRARRSAPAAASSARTARPSPAVRERWRARRPMMPPRALGRGRCRRSRARRAQTGARCGFGA